MNSLAVFACCLALVAAAPPCVDPFANIQNPCTKNPTPDMVYRPHPTDNTKFLQCDTFGRMYIVQCPAGEMFDAAKTSCTTLTLATTVAPARTLAPGSGVIPNTGNPCTTIDLTDGPHYFAVAGDNSRFIECDMLGNANILTCPSGLIWDESRLSCVYELTQLKPGTSTGSTGANTGLGSLKNPCTPNAVSIGDLFFPHPDPTKFFQCDLWGDVFVNDCPTGLVWNDYTKTCAGAYFANAGTQS